MALRPALFSAVLAAALVLPLSPAAAYGDHHWHSSDRYDHRSARDHDHDRSRWDRGRDRDRHWDRDRWERKDRDHRGPSAEPVLAPGSTLQPAPEPEPTREPTSAPAPGGSGGPLTDRFDVPFTAAGFTSTYHVYASGLDWDRPVGLLVYGDGSGGFGLDNPSSSYLLGGSNGLAAVARKHNLVLVVPEAPAPICDGYDNCWYDSANAAGKAAWANVLVTQVKSQYPIDEDRIVIGGYSSGAQWATRYFLPAHGEAQSVDLVIPVAYGGAPAVPTHFSEAYTGNTVVSFDTGTADSAYSTAAWGARGGHDWYTDAGFVTDAHWPSGVGHSRSGEFAGIVDREVAQHVPAA